MRNNELRFAAMANDNGKRLVLLGVIALFWIACVCSTAHGSDALQVQERARGFNLLDLSGEMVALEDYKGQFVLVDFWATWCVPCRKSLPELASVDQKYRNRGVTVLGLAVDDPDSFENEYIANFIEKYNVAYPILRATQQVVDQYLGKEQPQIPTLFIIDRQGRIVEKIVGFSDGAIELTIDKLILQQ
jgi:peroxiredoxin